jgi:uncharacterized membrane protein
MILTAVKKVKDRFVPATIQHIQQNRPRLFKFIVSILHIVGIIGMSIPKTQPIFQFLTPLHLILSLGILFLFHTDWNKSFGLFALAAFTIGFGSEVLGVHTGFPFGNYSYGPVLGTKLLEVPLIIGVNWLLLVYLSGNLLHKKIKNHWLAALLSAGLMVAIDFIIEPVAIALDFWSWESDIIPLSNYLGWFGTAFIIQLIYRKLNFQKANYISPYLLIHLITFFAILNFVL